MSQLKSLCDVFAEQIEQLRKSREAHLAEKSDKYRIAHSLKTLVEDELIPNLKKHALRVTLGKGLVDVDTL